jgi:hypothetical protein
MHVTRILAIALTALAAGGCATTVPNIDKAKVAAAHTITVAAPAPSAYPAAVGSVSSATVGLGLIGGLVGALIDGAHANKPAQFDSLVKQTLANPDLNREFVDAFKGELKKSGFEVDERDLHEAGEGPRLTYQKSKPVLQGAPLANADLVIVPTITTSYFAAGPMDAYQRQVFVRIALFQGKDNAFLGERFFAYRPGAGDPDDYHYGSFDKLSGDVEHAVEGLRVALLSLPPQVAGALR